MSSSRPTLYLGKVTVNDSEFNFNDSIVTVSTNPVSNESVATKSYVDDAVRVQKERIDAILDGAGVDIDQLKTISTLIATEVSNRVDGEAILNYKIDMLFKYFFRRSSSDATIDATNQIIFNN